MIEGKLPQRNSLHRYSEFKKRLYLLGSHPAAIVLYKRIDGLKVARHGMVKHKSTAAGLYLYKALLFQCHKPGVNNRLAYLGFLLKLAFRGKLVPGPQAAGNYLLLYSVDKQLLQSGDGYLTDKHRLSVFRPVFRALKSKKVTRQHSSA